MPTKGEKVVQRDDDFRKRRGHLAHLSEDELYQRFWQLAEQVVEPMAILARTHTSPSIERSVLLRMGFSSIEAREIVEGCLKRGLLGKGAGHVVWRLAQMEGITIREAGLQLLTGNGWDRITAFFQGGASR
ncbi:MAG: ornithine aminomutase subunit alpha [bacterium]|jgi:D-ornithine 4,5-aminomutase subunit alpha